MIAVIVLALALKGHTSRPTATPAGGQVSVTFRVAGVPPATALHNALTILRERLDATFEDVQVRQSGNQVTVAVGSTEQASSATRARVIALAQPGRLAFYNWEVTVLTPSGKTVASLLGSQDPAALTISQDAGSAGGMSLDQARRLSAQNPGTIVLRSQSTFFVLKDRIALTNADITHPVSTTDQAGQPAVTFGFTRAGARQFERLTARVAHRGDLVCGLGQTLNQHFAVAVDHQLITLPSIDFKSYPDGIPGNNGADIVGPFTTTSARDLATVLRYGPLSVGLIPGTGQRSTGP